MQLDPADREAGFLEVNPHHISVNKHLKLPLGASRRVSVGTKLGVTTKGGLPAGVLPGVRWALGGCRGAARDQRGTAEGVICVKQPGSAGCCTTIAGRLQSHATLLAACDSCHATPGSS